LLVNSLSSSRRVTFDGAACRESQWNLVKEIFETVGRPIIYAMAALYLVVEIWQLSKVDHA
jgi:hypothetical protein